LGKAGVCQKFKYMSHWHSWTSLTKKLTSLS
jgi:hypothetical protein